MKKTANTGNISEETKSEVLDMSRKLKVQQDLLDQMREQVDRLKAQVIQTKSREEAVTMPIVRPVENQPNR